MNAVLRPAQIFLGLFVVISCSSKASVSVSSVLLHVWISGLMCYLLPVGGQVPLGVRTQPLGKGLTYALSSLLSFHLSVCLSIYLSSIIYHLLVICLFSPSFSLLPSVCPHICMSVYLSQSIKSTYRHWVLFIVLFETLMFLFISCFVFVVRTYVQGCMHVAGYAHMFSGGQRSVREAFIYDSTPSPPDLELTFSLRWLARGL